MNIKAETADFAPDTFPLHPLSRVAARCTPTETISFSPNISHEPRSQKCQLKKIEFANDMNSSLYIFWVRFGYPLTYGQYIVDFCAPKKCTQHTNDWYEQAIICGSNMQLDEMHFFPNFIFTLKQADMFSKSNRHNIEHFTRYSN